MYIIIKIKIVRNLISEQNLHLNLQIIRGVTLPSTLLLIILFITYVYYLLLLIT